MKSGIYLITSPSGRRYVGQAFNLERRMHEYKGLHCKGQTYIYHSLKKYGFEQHKVKFLFECNRKDFDEQFLKNLLNDLETEFILAYKTFRDWTLKDKCKGMNLTTGGGSFVFSKETIAKMTNSQNRPETQKRRSNSLKIALNRPKIKAKMIASKKAMSAETKLLMSEAKKGIARSAECIAKISATKKAQYVKEKHPMFGTKHGVEARKKMKLARQKRIKANYETKLIRLKERKDLNEPLNVPKIIGVQKTIF
jgi:group I intron endonuclease